MQQAPNLFVSTAIQGEIAQLLGAPHYSYHFAAERFAAMLHRRGHPPVRLAMPEYYATAAALPPRPGAVDVHLIFRSTEQIRLLKPAVNICCFAWEFPLLKSDTLPGEHPFANQCAMLGLCHEVWTPSAYAARVLRAHGLSETHRIPAPIPPGVRTDRSTALATLGSIEAATLDINFTWPADYQDTRAEATLTTLGTWIAAHTTPRAKPTIVLSVLNPEDFRKNLDALLRGFHALRRTHPRALLLVKALTARSRFSLGQVAGGVIGNKLAPGTVLQDRGIAIINTYLSPSEMSLLYSLADHYVCTSLAEGQNLPLLEAMAHGTCAVTTCNTAMEDYVDAGNACIIPGRTVPNNNPHLAGTLASRPFDVALSTARDVHAALLAAIGEKPKSRRARARAGIATVQRLFGEDAVWPLLAQRLRHHAPAMPA